MSSLNMPCPRTCSKPMSRWATASASPYPWRSERFIRPVPMHRRHAGDRAPTGDCGTTVRILFLLPGAYRPVPSAAYGSMAASSSSVRGPAAKAATLSSSCPTLLAPTSAEVTRTSLSSQASAS